MSYFKKNLFLVQNIPQFLTQELLYFWFKNLHILFWNWIYFKQRKLIFLTQDNSVFITNNILFFLQEYHITSNENKIFLFYILHWRIYFWLKTMKISFQEKYLFHLKNIDVFQTKTRCLISRRYLSWLKTFYKLLIQELLYSWFKDFHILFWIFICFKLLKKVSI